MRKQEEVVNTSERSESIYGLITSKETNPQLKPLLLEESRGHNDHWYGRRPPIWPVHTTFVHLRYINTSNFREGRETRRRTQPLQTALKERRSDLKKQKNTVSSFDDI